MTLKDMMLGSAIAALVAGGAVAQSTSTETEAPDAGTSTEAPMTDTDSGVSTDTGTGMSTDAETDTDTGMSSDTDSGTSMETDTGMSSDTGTDTSMETDPSMDAGTAGDGATMDTTTGEMSGDAAPDAGATMAPEDDAVSTEGTDTMAPETDLGATDGGEAPMALEAMTVDDVLGSSVMGINDENVGDVNYVVEQSDGLAFVVGVGGFLGIGEHSVAIPADQFSVDADGNLVLSSMTEDDLKAMPEFSTDDVESLEGSLVIGDLMTDS